MRVTTVFKFSSVCLPSTHSTRIFGRSFASSRTALSCQRRNCTDTVKSSWS
uniref:Secreted protein n=1 Tax=Ascaris lumbricoides TaxID=6252 RepID=A0A0M3HSB3_ASCLU